MANLADDRVYIFTGSADQVVVFGRGCAHAPVLRTAGGEGQKASAIDDTVAAGHSIITDNPEDSPLDTNQPPYINRGGFMQSHDILRHIHGPLKPPAAEPAGRLVRFDQTEFFGSESRASMSEFGYAYVPRAVEEGASARVHIALHGCKQGYNYVNYVNGRRRHRQPAALRQSVLHDHRLQRARRHQQHRRRLSTGPGSDGNGTQNPDGCWDWWGYTSPDPQRPDYYSREAIQIKAIHGMLERLGG